MKKLLTIVVSAALLLGLASTSMAGINRRQYREHQRIRQGIRSGELTRREGARLRAEQARIRYYERYARRDGDLSARERWRLNRELNQASRHIYRQKHDSQDRNP